MFGSRSARSAFRSRWTIQNMPTSVRVHIDDLPLDSKGPYEIKLTAGVPVEVRPLLDGKPTNLDGVFLLWSDGRSWRKGASPEENGGEHASIIRLAAGQEQRAGRETRWRSGDTLQQDRRLRSDGGRVEDARRAATTEFAHPRVFERQRATARPSRTHCDSNSSPGRRRQSREMDELDRDPARRYVHDRRLAGR